MHLMETYIWIPGLVVGLKGPWRIVRRLISVSVPISALSMPFGSSRLLVIIFVVRIVVVTAMRGCLRRVSLTSTTHLLVAFVVRLIEELVRDFIESFQTEFL